jgi:hypothetical protein
MNVIPEMELVPYWKMAFFPVILYALMSTRISLGECETIQKILSGKTAHKVPLCHMQERGHPSNTG